jgi:hypothetical protein
MTDSPLFYDRLILFVVADATVDADNRSEEAHLCNRPPLCRNPALVESILGEALGVFGQAKLFQLI